MSKYENLLILHLLGVFLLIARHSVAVGCILVLTRVTRNRQTLLLA